MIRYSKSLGQQSHGRRNGCCCRCGRGSDEVKTCKNKALIRKDRRLFAIIENPNCRNLLRESLDLNRLVFCYHFAIIRERGMQKRLMRSPL